MRKKVLILGSTGSIGRQTLEVLQAFPHDFEVLGLTAYTQADALVEQANAWGVSRENAVLAPTKKDFARLAEKAEFIVNGLPGFVGLEASVEVLKVSSEKMPKKLLSANKESFAIAGKFLRKLAEENHAELRPLDSEASAIWQLLQDYGKDELTGEFRLRGVTLTCSGGPFFEKKKNELKNVTIEQALAHPTWKMGRKVSIDSATLVNKILEVYEVHHLFDVPLSKINIVIHRKSWVHSMVHLKSRATRMHITQNDMRLFISYALHFPTQPVSPWPICRKSKSEMDFAEPDGQTFLPLQWFSFHAGNPNFPIILNAANEVAVRDFLGGKIAFLDIYHYIENALKMHLWDVPAKNLEELLESHRRVTESTEAFAKTISARQF